MFSEAYGSYNMRKSLTGLGEIDTGRTVAAGPATETENREAQFATNGVKM